MEQIQEVSLKFSESPLCPVAADVICDGESIYFYMYDMDFENERLLARSACWVKNLVKAPKSFDKVQIEDDRQPVLPEIFLSNDADREPMKEEDLEIIWSKEGHIAALLHKGEIVSVIPSWADGTNFPGYSRYVKENNMVAWKLSDAAAILPRMEEGKTFWNQEFNMVWKEYNTPYYLELSELFGKAVNCYDIHKDLFPSRLLLTFEKEDYVFAFTIGTGMFSMPNADRYYDEYESRARTEFAISFPKDAYSAEEQMDLFSSMAGVCDIPWKSMDCVAHGHTLDMKFGNCMNCMIIDDDVMKNPLSLKLKEKGVHISWIVPLKEEEFAAAHDVDQKQGVIDKIAESYRNQ